MKKLRHFFSFLLAFSLLTAITACSKQSIDKDEPVPVKLKLSLGDLLEQELTRATVATTAEQQVKTMDVLFFDKTTGNRVIYNATPAYTYDLDHIDASQWEGGSTASQTVILNIVAQEVIGKKVVVLLNLPTTLQQKLRKNATETGYIATYDALNEELLRTITAIDEITTPLVMTGAKNVNAATDIVNNTVIVDVKRVIAKMQLHLYYQWAGLKLPSATNKAYYTYKDYEAKTFLGVNEPIDTRISGTETLIDPAGVETLAAPQRAKSVLPAIYINEYNITNTDTYPIATVPAPYILLRLPGVLGAENPISGIFPPPAGGETESTDVVYNYYKVVMPRQIERNSFYRIHATIVGPGSPTPDAAPLLKFDLSVLPWKTDVTIF